MHRTDAFRVEGVVIEALANGTYCVELANGHRVTGFIAGRTRKTAGPFAPGEKVKLQLTPYDLSSGRILVETKNEK
jgi:translation initiation factor IF-1